MKEYVKAFWRSLLWKEEPFFNIGAYIIVAAFICTCFLEYHVILAIINQLK